MTRVLFVCTANICRSPFMERYARAVAGTDSGVEFHSAGTQGFRDAPMDPPMAEELQRRGGDPTGFRSRRLTAAILDDADLVLTAERTHRRLILEEHPAALRRTFALGHLAELVTSGQDDTPYAGSAAAAVDALLARLAGQGNRATPEHDVDDPYGRGEEAARQAADRMQALLDPVIRTLTRA